MSFWTPKSVKNRPLLHVYYVKTIDGTIRGCACIAKTPVFLTPCFIRNRWRMSIIGAINFQSGVYIYTCYYIELSKETIDLEDIYLIECCNCKWLFLSILGFHVGSQQGTKKDNRQERLLEMPMKTLYTLQIWWERNGASSVSAKIGKHQVRSICLHNSSFDESLAGNQADIQITKGDHAHF